jgi:hypothetical protein
MAYSVANTPHFATLPPEAREFLILLCLCVGLLLLFVGCITCYFCLRVEAGDPVGRNYLFGMAVLFGARSVLELLYPVRVLGATPPILLGLSSILVLFLIAATAGQRPPPARSESSEPLID